MSDIGWNSMTIAEDEKPRVSMAELRAMARAFDPEDFDEDVCNFLEELERGADEEELRRAATLLLQDEVDLSPELADMGVEPNLDLITLLLACGADASARNPYGKTPLQLAVEYGYDAIVNLLETAGARHECGDECSCQGHEHGECHCHGDGHECSCGHEHS